LVRFLRQSIALDHAILLHRRATCLPTSYSITMLDF
jgi:hypothetical protein